MQEHTNAEVAQIEVASGINELEPFEERWRLQRAREH